MDASAIVASHDQIELHNELCDSVVQLRCTVVGLISLGVYFPNSSLLTPGPFVIHCTLCTKLRSTEDIKANVSFGMRWSCFNQKAIIINLLFVHKLPCYAGKIWWNGPFPVAANRHAPSSRLRKNTIMSLNKPNIVVHSNVCLAPPALRRLGTPFQLHAGHHCYLRKSHWKS